MNIDIQHFDFPNDNVRVTTFYNFKGGVGKTFSALNLSIKFTKNLPENNAGVLLVDLDGQCSLSYGLSRKLQDIRVAVDVLDDADPEQAAILQRDLIQMLANEDTEHIMKFWANLLSPDPVVYTQNQLRQMLATDHRKLFVINGSPHIYRIESWMNGRLDTLPDKFKLINMITGLAQTMGINHVIVDLNPGNTLLNKSVLARTDRLLVPMFLDEGSVNSVKVLFSWVLPEAREFATTVLHRYRPVVQQVMVLFNKYKKRPSADTRIKTSVPRFWEGVIRGLLGNQFTGGFMELSPMMESLVMKPKNLTQFDATGTKQEAWKVDEFDRNLQALIHFITHN